MAYSAFAVANAFIERAEQGHLSDLTPMKLQKLMYYAQAWHLKVTGEPLLDDNFVRWKFGPVIPSVYHEFKAFRDTPIVSRATTQPSREALASHRGSIVVNVPAIPDSDKSAWGLIDAIISEYGRIDGPVLAYMTHAEGSAWAAGGGANNSVITHDQIRGDTSIWKE